MDFSRPRQIPHFTLLAVGVLYYLSVSTAHADDMGAWMKDPQARFATYQAAHPNPDAEIAEIKAKTAACVIQTIVGTDFRGSWAAVSRQSGAACLCHSEALAFWLATSSQAH